MKPPTCASGQMLRGGPALRMRVTVRARELARVAGRVPPDVAQKDYEQAKSEITGEADPDLQNAMLDG